MANESYFLMMLFIILLPFFNLSITNPSVNDEDIIINISNYNYPDPNDPNVYRIALFGTNDIHERIFPIRLFNPITREFYEKGGAEYIGSYISILRNKWKDRFLWLDGGDQFEGGLEGHLSNGNIMNEFYNTKKLNGMGIGNHDVSFGYEKLIGKMKVSNFDYLVSNLYDSNTQSYEFMPNQKRSKLYKLDRVKIGVIGVTTLDISRYDPFFPKNIKIIDQKEIIRTEAKALREQGANAVILLSHIGVFCDDDENEKLQLQLRTKDTPQSLCKEEKEEFYKIVSTLEKGIIDGVIAGHRHGINHHWINNIPTMQSTGFAYSNIMYLSFDPHTLKFLPDKVSIEGPLPSCGKIFEKTRLCEYVSKNELVNSGQLKKFKFHNIIMEKDPELNKPLEEWRRKIKENENVYITETEIELGSNSFKETPLMNMVNDIGLKVTNADFSILNVGGFRTTWYPGPLNEIDMFDMSPFPTFFVTFEMTGVEAIKMLKTIQNRKALYPTGGIKQYFKKDSSNNNRLIDVKLFNGITELPFDPIKTYTICTSDYLSNGGSAMKEVLEWYTMKNRKNYPKTTREYVTLYLKNSPVIKENMYLDINNPRIRYVKTIN